jgi:6-phosphogluconolactonase
MAFARHVALCGPGLLLLALASAAFAEARPAPGKEAAAGKLLVYVGTYTNSRKSKGIYRLELDLASGKLTAPALAAEAADPSFLAIHPGRRFLYAVGELASFRGKKSGVVSGFAIDPKTGDLTLLNHQPSEGAGPCHLVVDRAGKHVLAANYGGGSACVLPIEDDGRLGKATAFVQHKGSGVNPDRQKEPHAHSINLDAANRFAFVADLGLDKVFVYRFDKASGTLTPNDPPAAAVAPGAGPRHFAFHPTGRYAYVINELDSTVTAFDYDAKRGALKPVQTVTTLPEGFKGKSWTAEVVVHPSGKFVYGSNRGHDSIAVFRVDAKTGQLTPAGHQSDRIKTPRNFAIDPTGAWMLVANQASDSVIVFRIDPDTGRLEPTGQAAEVPVPVCVRMMPQPR